MGAGVELQRLAVPRGFRLRAEQVLDPPGVSDSPHSDSSAACANVKLTEVLVLATEDCAARRSDQGDAPLASIAGSTLRYVRPHCFGDIAVLGDEIEDPKRHDEFT